MIQIVVHCCGCCSRSAPLDLDERPDLADKAGQILRKNPATIGTAQPPLDNLPYLHAPFALARDTFEAVHSLLGKLIQARIAQGVRGGPRDGKEGLIIDVCVYLCPGEHVQSVAGAYFGRTAKGQYDTDTGNIEDFEIDECLLPIRIGTEDYDVANLGRRGHPRRRRNEVEGVGRHCGLVGIKSRDIGLQGRMGSQSFVYRKYGCGDEQRRKQDRRADLKLAVQHAIRPSPRAHGMRHRVADVE